MNSPTPCLLHPPARLVKKPNPQPFLQHSRAEYRILRHLQSPSHNRDKGSPNFKPKHYNKGIALIDYKDIKEIVNRNSDEFSGNAPTHEECNNGHASNHIYRKYLFSQTPSLSALLHVPHIIKLHSG